MPALAKTVLFSGLAMDTVSAPDAGQHAAQMTFPTDLTGLWQGTPNDTAVNQKNDDSDDG